VNSREKITAHRWLGEHENRKLLLQNLPEEYRWHRWGEWIPGTNGYVPPLFMPADWHNIVELMLHPSITEDLVAILHDIVSRTDLTDAEKVQIWRRACAPLLQNTRGTTHGLFTKITRAGLDPRARAEEWSKRRRSQKALLAKLREHQRISYSFGYRVISAQIGRSTWHSVPPLRVPSTPLMAQTLRDARERVDRNLHHHPGEAGMIEDYATLRTIALTEVPLKSIEYRYAERILPSGKMPILPLEIHEDYAIAVDDLLADRGLKLAPYHQIKIKHVSVETQRSRQGFLPIDLDAAQYGKHLAVPMATVEVKVDPMRKYAVPASFDELPDDEIDESHGDVDWETAVSDVPPMLGS
jgi:hypothetical protein